VSRLGRFLAGMLLLAGISGAAAQQGFQQGFQKVPVFHLDRAEFVVSNAPLPPGDEADWRPTALPDNWYRSRSDFSGVVWYRMTFELAPPGPYGVTSVYMPRVSARFVSFFINGAFMNGLRAQGDARALNWDEPARFALSAALLRPGRNILYARVGGTGALRQGLASVTLGNAGEVLTRYAIREAFQHDALYVVGGGAAAAGLLALAFWLKNRRDSVMLWFGVTALTWFFMAMPWFSPHFGYYRGFATDFFTFPLRFAYAVPLLILCLRLGGKRLPWLEAAAWLFTGVGMALAALGSDGMRATVITVSSMAYVAALFVLLAFLVRSRAARHNTPFWWMTLAGVALAALLSFCDLGRWMGWLDYENVALAHFHVPVLLFAVGATTVDRYFKAIAAVERSNAELERRLSQKTREIEASYQRLHEVERERVLADERSRIMADMHDGVGASLIGLLGLVQSGSTQRSTIARRVQETLLELRLVVDSLGPVEGDLGVVLGSVRHRMREPIEESGVRFLWRIGELPVVDYLTPRSILAIQHIVLEAIANALRHAAATTIAVQTEAESGGECLRVCVLDDGRGFDPERVSCGRGLDTMQSRARALGGRVEIASGSERGTSVTLILPRHAPDPMRDPPVDVLRHSILKP
jgi:signal transduction histidine kinase